MTSNKFAVITWNGKPFMRIPIQNHEHYEKLKDLKSDWRMKDGNALRK